MRPAKTGPGGASTEALREEAASQPLPLGVQRPVELGLEMLYLRHLKFLSPRGGGRPQG